MAVFDHFLAFILILFKFSSRLDEVEEMLTENRVWRARNVDVGIVSYDSAQEWGMSGCMLRGSGIKVRFFHILSFQRCFLVGHQKGSTL